MRRGEGKEKANDFFSFTRGRVMRCKGWIYGGFCVKENITGQNPDEKKKKRRKWKKEGKGRAGGFLRRQGGGGAFFSDLGALAVAVGGDRKEESAAFFSVFLAMALSYTRDLSGIVYSF